ncbi:MAG: hypothetical protein R2798_14035 [Chitinophagales bacterium]|nr:hypothetical protein [Bacteroidota bacterium]MCB9043408.1 hypothetical protein [Chitinophagales bacterium]
MNHSFLALFLILCCFFSQQNKAQTPEQYTAHNKGKIYFFWGGNRDMYSKSDIHFVGEDYDFTLYDVTAHDKPNGWHVNYINPARMTIPQTNARVGYFISDHYNISLGVDHMKYVMNQNIRVHYSGYYPNPETYNENPSADELTLDEDFLTFEHTDGLNYVDAEFSRVDDISALFKIRNTDKIQLNVYEGAGVGVLYPRSNTKLLGKARYDEFHVAGMGVSLKTGLYLTFFKHFFIAEEIKGGFIKMNDIRTTASKADQAEQQFWFLQNMLAIGGIIQF